MTIETPARGTLQRAVRVLDELAGSDVAPSVRDVAEATGLSKSAVQRILSELVSVDLAQRDPATRHYRLGPRALAFGMAYQRRVDVRQAALPHMRTLCDETSETVGISVGFADRLLHVDQVEPEQNLHAKFHLGRPLPLWSGAPAKVLLAVRPDDDIHDILENRDHTDLEPVNPPSASALLEDVQKVREDGHARAFEETLVGVNTVSAPIVAAHGELVAVVSVTAPSTRMDDARMDELLPDLLRAAHDTSADLGWRGDRVKLAPAG